MAVQQLPCKATDVQRVYRHSNLAPRLHDHKAQSGFLKAQLSLLQGQIDLDQSHFSHAKDLDRLARAQHRLAGLKDRLARSQAAHANTAAALDTMSQERDSARQQVRELAQDAVRLRGQVVKLDSQLKAAMRPDSGLRGLTLLNARVTRMRSAGVQTCPESERQDYPDLASGVHGHTLPVAWSEGGWDGTAGVLDVSGKDTARQNIPAQSPQDRSDVACQSLQNRPVKEIENGDITRDQRSSPIRPSEALPRIIVESPDVSSIPATPIAVCPHQDPDTPEAEAKPLDLAPRTPLQAIDGNNRNKSNITPNKSERAETKNTPIKSTPRKTATQDSPVEHRPLRDAISSHPLVTHTPIFKRKDLTPRKITLATDLHRALLKRNLRAKVEYVSTLCGLQWSSLEGSAADCRRLHVRTGQGVVRSGEGGWVIVRGWSSRRADSR